MKFSAVILAGGESRRMGREKAWVEFRGESLLARAVATVRRAGAAEVFISGRKGEDYTAMGCEVLLDANPGLGPLGGIGRALGVAKCPLVLVLAVDLPCMTGTLLRRMLVRCDENTGVVPTCEGELEPLAAIYPSRSHQLAMAALAQKRLAARGFAEAVREAGMVRDFRVPKAERVCFANWNAPEDLPAAIRLGGRRKTR